MGTARATIDSECQTRIKLQRRQLRDEDANIAFGRQASKSEQLPNNMLVLGREVACISVRSVDPKRKSINTPTGFQFNEIESN